MFSLTNFLNYYGPMLATWQGMTALLALLVLGFLLVLVDRTKWVLLTVLLWMGTFGVSVGESQRGLLFIFDKIRPMSRVIDTALLSLMLIPMVMTSRGRRTRILGGSSIAFFIFGIVMSLRHFYDNSPDRAVLGLLTFVLIFATFSVGVSRWIQHPGDELAALYCIVVSAVMLSLATIVQLLWHYSGAMSAQQLAGTTENPNSFGSIIGLPLPIACYLMLCAKVPKLRRFVAAAFVGVGTLFLLWSGSRASAIGTAVAILFLFRTRLRFWFVAILVGGVILAVAVELLGIDITGMAHLTSTGNTRFAVWGTMVDLFLANPIFGVGSAGLFESTFLGVPAAFGIVGLIPFLVALGLAFREIIRASRAIRIGDGDKLLSNLLWGWLIAALVMCVSEAHLAGTFTFFVYSYYLMMTITTAIADRAPVDGIKPAEEVDGGAEFNPVFADSTPQFGAQYF